MSLRVSSAYDLAKKINKHDRKYLPIDLLSKRSAGLMDVSRCKASLCDFPFISNCRPMARDVFYGRRGRINTRELWEQMNTAAC